MMKLNPYDINTWPYFKPTIIAHDVGRSRDHSTAVIGGNSPFQPNVIGIKEFLELPQGLYGSPRACELAKIDHRYNSNALIIADLSNDPTYAEVLFDTFGVRVIGVHICRSGDGMTFERWQVKNNSILVYNVGRSYLLELLHSQMQSDRVRLVEGPESQRAYTQLMNLETELRETGTVYTCPSGQHDDLAISMAMLVFAARHPHLSAWINIVVSAHRPSRPSPKFEWGGVT